MVPGCDTAPVPLYPIFQTSPLCHPDRLSVLGRQLEEKARVCLTSSWRAPAASARSSEQCCFCTGARRSPRRGLARCHLPGKSQLCCIIKHHCTQEPKSHRAADRKVALRARAADGHRSGSTAGPCPSGLLPQITQCGCSITGIRFGEHPVPKRWSQPSYPALPNLVTGYFLVPASIMPCVMTRIKATGLGYRPKQNSRVPTWPSAAQH